MKWNKYRLLKSDSGLLIADVGSGLNKEIFEGGDVFEVVSEGVFVLLALDADRLV